VAMCCSCEERGSLRLLSSLQLILFAIRALVDCNACKEGGSVQRSCKLALPSVAFGDQEIEAETPFMEVEVELQSHERVVVSPWMQACWCLQEN
jgi:hypothetical protein